MKKSGVWGFIVMGAVVSGFLSFLLAFPVLSGCDSKIAELESERAGSNIATTETNGIVTATISASANSSQILVASSTSKVAESTVIFPPGTFTVATEIAIGEAVDQSSAILGELDMGVGVQTGDPVYIGPSDLNATVTTAQPLTIQIPLPLDKLQSAGLVEDTSKLVLIYTIYSDGWKSGIIPLTKANLLGAFLKQNFSGLGYFQIVYLAATVSAKEISSQIRPELESHHGELHLR